MGGYYCTRIYSLLVCILLVLESVRGGGGVSAAKFWYGKRGFFWFF